MNKRATQTGPSQRTLFLNGVEIIGEAQIWNAMRPHIYKPSTFIRESDRWQAHVREIAPPATYRPCHTEATIR